MTKQHFIVLADYIKTSTVPFTEAQLGVIADFCQSQNPAFNRSRWFGYIRGENGPSGGVVTREAMAKRYSSR